MILFPRWSITSAVGSAELSEPAKSLIDQRAGLGIVMMLIAWAFFSMTDTSVKWLVLASLPALQLAFMRYFVALILSIGNGFARGEMCQSLNRGDLALLLLRGSLLVVATLLNFIALNYLPLSITSSIMNSSPIIVTALAVPLLGERVGPWRWSAVVLGFLGVLTVIRPFGAEFHWATLLILANATGLALFSILTRKLSGRITPQTMQITMGILGTLVLLPGALLTWRSPETGLDWTIMIGIGLWAWIGHEIFSRAHQHAEANLLMPFSYSFIIYLTAAGYFVFGSVPDTMTLVGAAIIVTSGLVIWWRETIR